MTVMRRSPSSELNASLREEEPKKQEGNREWLRRHGDADGILLLGGTSVTDFHIRVAQSSMRRSMDPSWWSSCGILLAGGVVATVPFDIPDVCSIPGCNGVRRVRLEDYDDPARFPNVAVIRFAEKHDNAIRDIARVAADRSIIDLPALMLPWLGYLWGVGGATNPLAAGAGLPGAAFVETVFAMGGFDLTPGLSSASSCPEAIWQSARWWTHYYRGTVDDARARSAEVQERAAATGEASPGALPTAAAENPFPAIPMIPQGAFTIRQISAAVNDALS